MAKKKPEWSDYAYDNESISKRLGIPEEEVRQIKAKAAEEIEGGNQGGDISSSDAARAIAAIKKSQAYVGSTPDLKEGSWDLSIGIPGVIDIQYDFVNKDGQIDFLKFIKMEVAKVGCYFVKRYYLAGQFLYSDVVRDPECEEEEEEEDYDFEDNDEDFSEPEDIRAPRVYGLWVVTYSSSTRVNSLLNAQDRIIHYFDGPCAQRPILANATMTHDGFSNEIKEKIDASGKAKYSGIENKVIFTASRTRTRSGSLYQPLENSDSETVNFLLRDKANPIVDGNGRLFSRLREACGKLYCYVDRRTVAGVQIVFAEGYGNEIAEIYNGNQKELYITNNSSYGGGWIFNEPPTKQRFILQYRIIPIPWTMEHELPPKKPTFNDENNEMNDKCCILLQRLARYQGLGKFSESYTKAKDSKIEPKGDEDQFPIEIPKRWIDRDSKPDERAKIENMRHLLLTMGTMIDRFEELFNPAGKQLFPLKKPEEGIWKWLPGQSNTNYSYPDPDDDPKRGKPVKQKELKVENYLDLFNFLLESSIRQEVVFPVAQLKDSKIDKGLLYPKAKGEQKIHDLIQFYEVLFLYLNKTLGDPTQEVVLEDANPAQEGAQTVTLHNFDLSDMMRKALKFILDINSDVDLGNNMGKRSLYELLMIHQLSVKNHELCNAIFEDTGMKENQEYVPVPMAADPYAGKWKAGQGFASDPDLDENTEEAVEKNLEQFLRQTVINVLVSKKDKSETTDQRDILSQIGRDVAAASAVSKIPNTPQAIQQAIDKAKVAIKTDGALNRIDVRQALTGGRFRKKKRKK